MHMAWRVPVLLTMGVALGFLNRPAIAASGDAASAATSQSQGTKARDAGARYGQALGVLEVCYGSRLTEKARALPRDFSGADAETFKAQAAKIYDAWVKVRGCANQLDPNQCKIIMDKSCVEAEKEIGGSGTAMPGLVEFLHR